MVSVIVPAFNRPDFLRDAIESVLSQEDYDLWLRLALVADAQAVERPLCCVRKHHSHYDRNGVRPAAARCQMLARVHALVSDPALGARVQAERSAAAVRLARMRAGEGKPREAIRVLARSYAYSRLCGRWWLGAAQVLLRLAMPAPAIALCRRWLRGA